MLIFKFRDKIDGNLCFVLAEDLKEAIAEVEKVTSIPVEYVGKRTRINPKIIFNQIAPF